MAELKKKDVYEPGTFIAWHCTDTTSKQIPNVKQENIELKKWIASLQFSRCKDVTQYPIWEIKCQPIRFRKVLLVDKPAHPSGLFPAAIVAFPTGIQLQAFVHITNKFQDVISSPHVAKEHIKEVTACVTENTVGWAEYLTEREKERFGRRRCTIDIQPAFVTKKGSRASVRYNLLNISEIERLDKCDFKFDDCDDAES